MSRGGDRTPLIGVVGGGQLGRMLALAGLPLGFRFRFLEPRADPPVRDLGEVVRAEYDDATALAEFGRGLSAVTYEFENVPAEVFAELHGLPVFPPPAALALSQDRVVEKETFRRAGILTAASVAVGSREELDLAVGDLGLPAILKTRRFGYDGKGQWVIEVPADLDGAWAAGGGRPLILERRIRFERELSVLVARSPDGRTASYPPGVNVHRDGILRVTRAPVLSLSDHLEDQARSIARRVADELEYVGLLAIELFEADGSLLANELAPRVHNSGHWTQDGAYTSQFENHLRAGMGLPLGSTEPKGWCAMVNLVGELPEIPRILEVPGTRVHLYDKEPRVGRKLGHVNLVAPSPDVLEENLGRVLELVP